MLEERILNPISKSWVGEVYITVKYDDEEGRLSITGVEGPNTYGNCRGAAGQIDMHLRTEDRKDWTYNPGWDDATMDRLLAVWDRWHLNDMRAGTPVQEAFMREWKKTNKYTYEEACKALRAEGLYVDYDYLPLDEDGEKVGYSYGTAWLFEPVPEDVLDFLFNLPRSTHIPAWH